MYLHCKSNLNRVAFTAFIFGAVLAHRVEAAGVLTVDDGFPPNRFSKMAKSDCQIITGFPVDVSNPNRPANVLATSAYASTGFVPDQHMLWNLVALYDSDSQDAANVFNKGLYELQTEGKLKSLITPYQQAAPDEVQRASARWDAPHMQAAVAWSTDSGRWIRVADTRNPGTTKQKPAATPGSLSNEQYEQIMAFILQQNGYPAGPNALVYGEAAKSSVPIRYHGK